MEQTFFLNIINTLKQTFCYSFSWSVDIPCLKKKGDKQHLIKIMDVLGNCDWVDKRMIFQNK